MHAGRVHTHNQRGGDHARRTSPMCRRDKGEKAGNACFRQYGRGEGMPASTTITSNAQHTHKQTQTQNTRSHSYTHTQARTGRGRGSHGRGHGSHGTPDNHRAHGHDNHGGPYHTYRHHGPPWVNFRKYVRMCVCACIVIHGFVRVYCESIYYVITV